MRERHGGQSESRVRGQRGGGRWERIAGRNKIGQRSGSVWAMGQDGIVGHEGAWGSRDNEEGLGSVARGADGWEGWGIGFTDTHTHPNTTNGLAYFLSALWH